MLEKTAAAVRERVRSRMEASEPASVVKKSVPSTSSEESKDIESSDLSDDDKPVGCLRCPSCRAMLPRDLTKGKKTVTIEEKE